MPNISDIIEAFLIETLGENERLVLSRNELAAFFACAPSQINYVLSTRFTPERGYTIESKRGGGGSVTVVRLIQSPYEAYGDIMNCAVSDGLSYSKAAQMLDRMMFDEIITEREAGMLKVIMSDKTLLAPTVIKDGLRSSLLKNVLLHLLKYADNEDV